MTAERALVPRLNRDAWGVLAGDTLSAIGSGMTLPFFLIYLSEIRGIDVAVAGLATATIALVGLVGNPCGGWLSDRIGPKPALAAGLVVAAAGALTVTAVRDPWQAFVSAAIVGFGAAVVFPAQDALLAVVVTTEQRSGVFAVRNATLNAGYGIGGVSAAFIVDLDSASSFATLYLVDAITFLLFLPLLAGVRIAVPTPSSTQEPPGSYREVVRDRAFVRLWLLFVVLVAAGFAQTTAGFPAYATGDIGVSASVIGICGAANTLFILSVQLFVLRRMHGRRRTTGIVLACLCWALAWSGVYAVGSVVTDTGTAAVLLVMAMVVFAFGETLLAPSQAALVNDLAPDRLRGRYNGAYALSWTVGLTIGPAVAGICLGAGRGDELFLGLVVVCLMSAVAAAQLPRQLPAEVNRVTA